MAPSCRTLGDDAGCVRDTVLHVGEHLHASGTELSMRCRLCSTVFACCSELQQHCLAFSTCLVQSRITGHVVCLATCLPWHRQRTQHAFDTALHSAWSDKNSMCMCIGTHAYMLYTAALDSWRGKVAAFSIQHNANERVTNVYTIRQVLSMCTCSTRGCSGKYAAGFDRGRARAGVSPQSQPACMGST